MSEHKSNAVALFNATLPALLHGDQLANATFELKVLPKENVLLLLPHHIRHTEVGAVEIQVPSKPGEWQAPPEGGLTFGKSGKSCPPINATWPSCSGRPCSEFRRSKHRARAARFLPRRFRVSRSTESRWTNGAGNTRPTCPKKILLPLDFQIVLLYREL